MSKLFLVNIDMNGNEIQNVVLQPLATAPQNATVGRVYYDTTDNTLKTFDGTNWNPAGAVLSVNNKTGVVTITKSDIGLGNVDNKSEATIKSDFTGSIADGNTGFITGDMIYDKLGAANGIAQLDSNGKIPTDQLPSSVDEVVFAYGASTGSAFPNPEMVIYDFYEDQNQTKLIPKDTGKIYVWASNNNKLYRYDGSNYVEVNASLALGETSSTAYRGDRGKTAYDHSQLTSGNPHNVSKSDVGLGNVDNKSEATIKSDFTGSVADGNTGFVTGDAVYDAIQTAAGQIPVATTTSPKMDGTAAVGSETKWAKGDHVHPTDTSRMAANLKGAANGVAELDANGKVPSSQLPSYVDDVIEGYAETNIDFDGDTPVTYVIFFSDAEHEHPIQGESGKIYIDISTGKTYRYTGTSSYAEISASLALGETSSTAYRGDRGKTAYDHSQLTSGNPHNVSKSDVGLGNVDNTSDATKKTNFTGSIASGNTGFATGGAVYTELGRLIKTQTVIIGTSSTSASVTCPGPIINAYAKQGNNICIVDIAIDRNSVTFSVAAAPSQAITCVVVTAYPGEVEMPGGGSNF